MIKRFIIAFVLLVLVAGGIVGFNLFRDQAIKDFFAGMKPPPVTVSTVTVEPITWTPGIDAIGTVGAAQGVDLTVETTGVVETIDFTANERVAKDKVLVQLDDAKERADLAAVKAQAALDQQALERALELQKRGVNTDVTVDSARAAATASAAQVARAQAVVDQKQVRAPFAGTMGIPRIEEGQYISPGTKIATLQDLSTMRVDFTVPEQRFNNLRIGQPVTFGLTAGDMPFKGSVTGIDPKVDPVSRLVSVRADMTNPEGRVNPGQFLQVRVILPTEQDIIAIPQTALVSSLYGDFVYVVREAKAPEQPAPAEAGASDAVAADAEPAAPAAPSLAAYQIFVKAGRRAAGMVEITEGLSAGDRVVTAGQNRLFSGSPVTIDNTVNPLPAAAADLAGGSDKAGGDRAGAAGE
ncbi:MAG: efflux RND transporter periplasmic adaptor subunit [Bauldia sp.]|uniref:efflux RND transporter periplasmic adaptor subunit n=1 Tax=Bauldia sp. TaxID=2575872 RepID=UPI001D5522AE|nr:efflux RND transporter periplasmic adaptor subunit [Bauldia sp.]MCB1497203.1 efflux RND transporter periplasmic adaptor subunit [Bauldia sp.]